MCSPPYFVDFEKTLDEVVEKFSSFNVGSLLVKKDGDYVGMLQKVI